MIPSPCSATELCPIWTEISAFPSHTVRAWHCNQSHDRASRSPSRLHLSFSRLHSGLSCTVCEQQMTYLRSLLGHACGASSRPPLLRARVSFWFAWSPSTCRVYGVEVRCRVSGCSDLQIGTEAVGMTTGVGDRRFGNVAGDAAFSLVAVPLTFPRPRSRSKLQAVKRRGRDSPESLVRICPTRFLLWAAKRLQSI